MRSSVSDGTETEGNHYTGNHYTTQLLEEPSQEKAPAF